MRTLVAALALAAAGPAAANEPSWLLGTWCGNLDVMRVTTSGLSFNDQAECQWAAPPTPARNYTTMLSCLEMQVEDGERIRLEPWEGMIDFTQVAGDTMEAFFEGDPDPVIYTRCKG